MTRALSTVAAVVLLAAGAWWLLSTMAGLEAAGPAPDIDARLLEGSAATGAALDAAGERPDPVTFSMTVNGGTLMAGARRNVTLGAAWSGVLEVPDQVANKALIMTHAETSSVMMSGLGASAAVANGGGPEQSTHGTWYDSIGIVEDPPGEFRTRYEIYLPFTVSVSTGEDNDSQFFWLYCGEIVAESMDPMWAALDPSWLPPNVPVVNDIAVNVAATLTNVFVRGYRSEHPPSSRQTMDWSDLRGNEEFYANENSAITVTATGPGGISLSANGNMGYGGETALGPNPWMFSFGFQINSFPEADTIYARVSNPAFNLGMADLSLLSLWYAGTELGADRAPDQSTSESKKWSQFEADATAAKVHVLNSGGAAIRREATGSVPSPLAWSTWCYAPVVATFVPQP